ncbi:MAG: glycosyltransferase family 4 protein [Candidatus Stahlbacteria bacterium]|nr:glycosyltransferase family 4 protein [Candidatus Stahlbacteria bacterium]
MQILIISPWSNDWDIERVVGGPKIAVLIKGFAESGIKVHLLIPAQNGFKSSNVPNLFIHPIPILSFPQLKLVAPIMRVIAYLSLNLSFILYGLKLAKQYNFNLIYGLSSFLGLATYWLGKRLSKPTILKLLGIITLYPFKKYSPLHWLIYFDEIIAYKLPVDKLIVVDDGTQGDKAAAYFNVPQNRFVFEPHIVDKRLALVSNYPDKLKAKLGFKTDDYIILFNARLGPLKRLSTTLKAMKLVLEVEPRAKLLIVGDGPTRNKDEKLAKKLGIYEDIKFAGSIKYIDMWQYYRIADVFLSTNTYSNLCLPTVEAMISGVPVVTLDIRDTHKLIKTGITGLLIGTCHSVSLHQEIAGAICLLLRDASLRNKIIDNSRKYILSNVPDWTDGIEFELKLIKSVIK